MRLGFILPEVMPRSALQPGPLDYETLAGLARRHDVELFLDQSTPSSCSLEEQGARVHVSLKRPVWNEQRGTLESADVMQARVVAARHAESPFDALVYSSLLPIDLAWYEPSLREIPRGVALGSGIPHDVPAIWQDPVLFAAHGRQVFSLTGLLSSADFLLTTAGAPGLAASGELLPPDLVLEEPVAQGGHGAAAPEPKVVVVAATGVGCIDLPDLLSSTSQRVAMSDETILVVIVRVLHGALRPTERMVLAGVERRVREQVIVVSADEDGVAADWLDSADFVVCASRAELRIEAFGQALREKGGILLSDQGPAKIDGCFPADVQKRRRSSTACEVIAWETLERDRRRQVEMLDIEDPETLVLVHEHGLAGPGARLTQLSDLARVDLVVWGRPTGLYGQPDPAQLYRSAVGIRAGMLVLLSDAFVLAGSLWEFIQWAVDVEWSASLRMMVMPGSEHGSYSAADAGRRLWATVPGKHGLLPEPRYAPSHDEAWNLQHVPAALRERTLVDWVRETRWPERLRVLLPWRWGLLERAMRDQW